MTPIEIQLALSNYIKTVSTNSNINILFELEDKSTPYTTKTCVHLHKTSAFVSTPEELLNLRSYIAQQISHIMFTHFETSAEIPQEDTKLLQAWSDLSAVRSNYMYINKGYKGDRDVIVHFEENYKKDTHKYLADNTKVDTRTLATAHLTYNVRSTFLEELGQDNVVSNRLQGNKLASKILSLHQELVDACLVQDNKKASEELLKIAKKIVKMEEDDKKENKEEQEANEENKEEQEANEENKEEQKDTGECTQQPGEQVDGREERELPARTTAVNQLSEARKKVSPHTGDEVCLDPNAGVIAFKLISTEDDENQSRISTLYKGPNKKRMPAVVVNLVRKPTAKDKNKLKPGDQAKMLAKNLKRYLLVRSKTKKRFNLKKGRINSKALYKITLGENAPKNIFKNTEVATLLDTSIMLLVDNSGSMHGDRYALASQATLILCDTLKKLNVAHAVHHFTTPYNALTAANYITKDWGDNFNDTALLDRIAALNDTQYCNADSDALHHAYLSLRTQKTARKILIVLSDGQPNGNTSAINYSKTTKYIVKKLESLIDVYSIGIKSSEVKKYYKNNAVLYEIEHLPKKLLEVLKKALTHGE